MERVFSVSRQKPVTIETWREANRALRLISLEAGHNGNVTSSYCHVPLEARQDVKNSFNDKTSFLVSFHGFSFYCSWESLGHAHESVQEISNTWTSPGDHLGFIWEPWDHQRLFVPSLGSRDKLWTWPNSVFSITTDRIWVTADLHIWRILRTVFDIANVHIEKKLMKHRVVDLGIRFPTPLSLFQSELKIKIYGKDTLTSLVYSFSYFQLYPFPSYK